MQVGQGRKHIRVALARHDGTDNPHVGCSSDICHNMMELKVHLHQRLLHVLNVGGGIFDQPLALPHVCAQAGVTVATMFDVAGLLWLFLRLSLFVCSEFRDTGPFVVRR